MQESHFIGSLLLIQQASFQILFQMFISFPLLLSKAFCDSVRASFKGNLIHLGLVFRSISFFFFEAGDSNEISGIGDFNNLPLFCGTNQSQDSEVHPFISGILISYQFYFLQLAS